MKSIAIIHDLSAVLYGLSFFLYWRYFISKHERTGRYASWAILTALILHTTMLVLYTLNRGHLPLGQFAKAATTFVWVLGVMYLIQQYLLREREFGVFVTGILVVVQSISVLSIEYRRPLADILKNVLFEIHVLLMIVAYAAFALAFIAALMYLLLFNEIHGHRFGLFYSRLPSLEFLDQLNIRSVLSGLVILTVGILLGMWNAANAWGFAWQWDPKLTVVFINWLLYLYFAVSYSVFQWRGQRTAVLSVVGFLAVMFSFFIVTNFSSTIHTF